VAVILDAGALIAIDHRDRKMGAILRVAQRERLPVRTSAAALAQVWRNGARQVNLTRSLAGIDTVPIEEASGKQVGELLARSGTADVIDAHVVLLAMAGDHVATSDPFDLEKLLDARRVATTLVIV
jgi:hypothetical protein